MNYDWQKAIDLYYPANRKARGILLAHSHAVAKAALAIAQRQGLDIPADEIVGAAMLHDIGIIATDAPGIDCHGSEPYLCHGPIGADMLRRIGAPEIYALVAERHTGAGLTPDEITAAALPLPPGRSYMPGSTLERLVCYADCFYSKGTDISTLSRPKPIERVRASMSRFGQGVLSRFETLANEFGSLPTEL